MASRAAIRSVSSGEEDASSTATQKRPSCSTSGAGGSLGLHCDARHGGAGTGASDEPTRSAGMRAKSSSSVFSIAGV